MRKISENLIRRKWAEKLKSIDKSLLKICDKKGLWKKKEIKIRKEIFSEKEKIPSREISIQLRIFSKW